MAFQKLIVAHPAQQHSYRLAAAFKRKGVLLKYITCVYDKKHSLGMAIARRLVRGKDSEKLLNRRCEGLREQDVRLYDTLLSLAVIVLSRSARTKPLSYRLDRRISERFGKKTARYAVRNGADAVICFSTNARSCFAYLQKRAPQIKRIVDCANSPLNYMRALYEKDMKLTGEDNLRREVPSFFDEKVLEKERRELELTEVFLAPSDFVIRGLRFCGVPEEKIRLLPYGSNFPISERPQAVPERVRFIFVGQISYRKGVHHLLSVFSELPEAELDLVGQLRSQELRTKYKGCANLYFHGQVLHDQVKNLLQRANVFVFASLSEGLSLACIEALSCGLPIVCSAYAGANDLVREGENGFVFEPSDHAALKKHVQFFMEHPEVIPRMSEAALQTASSYTWERYEAQLCNLIDTL